MKPPTLRTVLIDDEASGRRAVQSFLERYYPEVEVVGEADGVASGLSTLLQLRPHLVFLDIQMQDGTGFDLLKKLKQYDFFLIFVTAYDQFALRAFEFAAMDYLLKPLDPAKLQLAMERVRKQDRISVLEQQIQLLQSARVKVPERIALPSQMDFIRKRRSDCSMPGSQ